MSEESLQKAFHDKMFELRVKQAYYVMEHKKDNPDLAREIINLKKSFAKELSKEMIGDVNNVECKRK